MGAARTYSGIAYASLSARDAMLHPLAVCAALALHRVRGRFMRSWADKLDQGKPVLKPSPRASATSSKASRCWCRRPGRSSDFIRSIPEGASWMFARLRTALAIEHGAEVTCPVTSAIICAPLPKRPTRLWSAACRCADITPFWRVLDAKDADDERPCPSARRCRRAAQRDAQRRPFGRAEPMRGAPTGFSRSSSICAAAVWSPRRSSASGSRFPNGRSTAISPTCSRPACRSTARPASAT